MDSVALATSKYQNNNLKKEVSKAKNVSFLWKLYAILATSAVVYQTIK
jgi:outer membrane receptor protein involved in Fe transport